MTKTINAQHRLQYAISTIAVVRTLEIVDKTMRYSELARVIGLLPVDEKWNAWYRGRITDVLNLAAATERTASKRPSEYGRIVSEDGKPGKGFLKTSRIVDCRRGRRATMTISGFAGLGNVGYRGARAGRATLAA